MELEAGVGDNEKTVGMGFKCRKSYRIGNGDGKYLLVVMVGEAEDGVTILKQLKRYYAVLELCFIESLFL
jgi:hypothetical protein